MLKRQIFGRAHLDLLSRRFVLAPRSQRPRQLARVSQPRGPQWRRSQRGPREEGQGMTSGGPQGVEVCPVYDIPLKTITKSSQEPIDERRDLQQRVGAILPSPQP